MVYTDAQRKAIKKQQNARAYRRRVAKYGVAAITRKRREVLARERSELHECRKLKVLLTRKYPMLYRQLQKEIAQTDAKKRIGTPISIKKPVPPKIPFHRTTSRMSHR